MSLDISILLSFCSTAVAGVIVVQYMKINLLAATIIILTDRTINLHSIHQTMVFPSKIRQPLLDGSNSTSAGDHASSAAISSSPSAIVSPTKTIGKLLLLTPEQTKDFNFQVGCPVWYNFTPSRNYNGGSQMVMKIREGVIDSISLDIFSKTLVFKVARNQNNAADNGNALIDTVFEDDIAYAVNCPVFLTTATTGDASSTKHVEGEIMFAKPVQGENTEISYIVKVLTEVSSQYINIEEGVKASRLKYRIVEKKLQVQVNNEAQEEGAKNSYKNIVPPPSSHVSEGEHSNGSEDPAGLTENSIEGTSNDIDQYKKRMVKLNNPPRKQTRPNQDGFGRRIHDMSKKRPMSNHDHHSSRGERDAKRHHHYDGPRRAGFRRQVSGHSFTSSHSGRKIYKGQDRRSNASFRSIDQDAQQQDNKAKLSKNELASENKVREENICDWDLPHTWHENDGAI